jgi:integrase
MVRRVFNRAVESGLIVFNPAAKIKVKIPETKQLALSSKEIEILLREAKLQRHRFYEVWALALLTGMRSGELYALKWTDVEFENGLIHVTKSWNSKNGIGPTKSSKNRIVPLSKAALTFLRELKLKAGSLDHVLPRLQEWTKGSQATVLKNFCRSLCITAVKFHDLRATYITQLLMNGVPVSKVMAIVGHAELKTTQGYLRMTGKDLMGATECLGIELPKESNATVLSFSRTTT